MVVTPVEYVVTYVPVQPVVTVAVPLNSGVST